MAYYERALEIDPQKIENLYRVAETALIFYNYGLAEEKLLAVAAHEEWEKYPLVDYMLADAKKSLGKYAEAEDLFKRFAENAKPDIVDPAIIAQARKEVINCQKAPTIIEDSLDYITVENLTNINTPNSEFGALVHGENELYYSSLRFKEESDKYEPDRAIVKIYNSYGEAEGDRLSFEEGETEMKKHLAHSALSADNKRLYYTECEYIGIGDYRCDLYYRERLTDTTWSAAVMLPENINQIGFNTTQPNTGVDEKGQEWLFFSSNRPNGRGGMDIWCSLVQANGRFSSPFNIRNLNSSGNDITPFFHNSSQTLYFSSESNINLGGYDIFKAEKDGLRYKDPVNLGYPINTSYNDTYFTMKPNGRIGHLSSNRPGGVSAKGEENEIYSTCCNDIYRLDIDIKVDLIAHTFNQLNGDSLLGTSVVLMNLTDDVEVELKETENHHFFYDLELEKKYSLIAEKPRYSLVDTVFFHTDSIYASTTIEKDIFLIPPIDLTALVYDKIDNSPLKGVRIEITAFSPENPDIMKYTTLLLDTINMDGHDFHTLIDFDKDYKIIASKEGYSSDELIFTTKDLEKKPQTILKELYLSPKTFGFPIVLYFDNDRPHEDSRDTIATVNYGQTYEAYIGHKNDFIREYAKTAKNAAQRQQYREDMESFFTNEVKLGYDKLQSFTTTISNYLKTGKSLEIVIKGFASPRAENDYNVFLTKRRISSVKNQLAAYSPELKNYIEKGILIIQEKAEGEDTANTNIPDEKVDEKKSIYNIDASRERRVEILEVNAVGLSGINN